MTQPHFSVAASRLQAAAEHLDLTPPTGIYNRMWGAALTDISSGVHRPITATVLVMRADREAPPHVLISIDWCTHPPGVELDVILAPTIAVAGDASRVILACTHTHGVGRFCRDRAELPGGDLIAPYLERVREAIAAAASRLVVATAEPQADAVITWATGRCDLATNRDLQDPDAPRIVTGHNPDAPADDTLLVARLTRPDGRPVCTIVNYACHPTTLAWENTLISPDYIGAMRETVEAQTDDAPCLFLQGMSGDLAPAWQYVGDPAVADTHGRRLGYAVLATLAGMLPPGQTLDYQGVKESGAPLGLWRPGPTELPSGVSSEIRHVPIELKPLPSADEVRAQIAAATDRAMRERLQRKLQQVLLFGDGDTWQMPVWCWQIGPARLVASGGEPYSQLQRWLREAHDGPVFCVNVANGWSGYFPPADHYDLDQYTVWQTPFARGSLERLRDHLT